MSYIPDCRVDEVYNQKYLCKDDKLTLFGYDHAVDQAELFLDNLEIYKDEFDIDGEDINLVRFLDNHKTIKSMLRGCISDYLERSRDEMIVSMIDNMNDTDYAKVKEKADEEE